MLTGALVYTTKISKSVFQYVCTAIEHFKSVKTGMTLHWGIGVVYGKEVLKEGGVPLGREPLLQNSLK